MLQSWRQIWEWKKPLLSKVLQFVRRGWAANNTSVAELSPFSLQRAEVTFRFGVFSRNLMAVPSRHRKSVIKELHDTHTGMTQIKGLEWMFVWWPWIDEDIERTVQLCQDCQTSLLSPPFSSILRIDPWISTATVHQHTINEPHLPEKRYAWMLSKVTHCIRGTVHVK